MEPRRRPLQDSNHHEMCEAEQDLSLRVLGSSNHLSIAQQVSASKQYTPQAISGSASNAGAGQQENVSLNFENLPAVSRHPSLKPASSQENESKPDSQPSDPVMGLKASAGTIHLFAPSTKLNLPPAGLLTEIRRVQQDVCNERKLADLRLEIMCVQEDVRRESESEASSTHSPIEYFSHIPSSRYQDTPSSRKEHSSPFRAIHSGATSNRSREDVLGSGMSGGTSYSPGIRPIQSTLTEGLIPLKEMLLRSGSSDSTDEPDIHMTVKDVDPGAASLLTCSRTPAEVCARLAALRQSKRQMAQASCNGSDESDTMERLAALQTRNIFAEDTALQQDAYERVPTRITPSFIPRAGPTLSYMEKKVQRLQAVEWEGVSDPKPHKCRLEQIKDAAALSRRDTLGSAEKACTRRLVQQAVATAVRTEGKGLAESLVSHKSRLERDKEAALASKAYEKSDRRPQQCKVPSDKDLGSILIKHKSKLEVEKEKAKAANQPANESQPRYMRSTVASRYATQANKGSLEDSLTVHRSRLERERDAARRDPKPRLRAKVQDIMASAPDIVTDSTWGDLGSMKVHKSRLEKVKETYKSLVKQPARANPSSSWKDGSLDKMRIHKSKLERDKEAWMKAAAQQQAIQSHEKGQDLLG